MANSLKTAVLLAAMGGLAMAIGGIFGGAAGVTIGLVIGLIMAGGSYWFSDKLAIKSAKAQLVTPQQLPQYYSIMEELTQKWDMPMPALYVSPNNQPNAFATGRNPKHAAVAITTGLMDHLTWDEIRGVLAHELAHIRNRDILVGSVAAAVAMGITWAVRLSYMFGGNRGRNSNPFAGMAMMILAPMAAGLLQMAISRTREYKADRAAARLIGDGEPLARALEKLGNLSGRIPADVPMEQASSYIANPLAGRKQFGAMFSTHPPMDERISRLRGGAWAE